MEYKVKLTDEQEKPLKQIENAIIAVIQNHPFPIVVKYGGMVVNKKGYLSYQINDNANFSIEGSFDIRNRVEDVLKSANLESIIPDFALIIKLEFKDKKGNHTQKEGKEVTESFIPIEPRYSLDQIIMSDELRNKIIDSIKLIECKELIYNKWGYGRIEPVAKNIINMYGPAGTGKTMCAHAIAKKLGKKILALQYSEIESKYLGDSAKNLKKAFETAVETDSVMFFDEADSFLGKRIENISNSTDQALNSLRSQMLILLEEHNGIVLFATNLVSNFDPAFNSRIQTHIQFELPNKEARIAIIKKQIPNNLPHKEPFNEEKIAEASDYADGFNGREIKNAMFNMYLKKADVNNVDIDFTSDDIIEAMKAKRDEKQKLESEQNERVKQRIIKKLSEKAEEDRIKTEYEKEKNESSYAENQV